MRNTKIHFSLLMVCFLLGGLNAQQQTSKSKSADKLYEKGELNHNVILKNTLNINSENLDFSPAFYENGLVWVTSRYKKGPKDEKLGTTFFEIFYGGLYACNQETGRAILLF